MASSSPVAIDAEAPSSRVALTPIGRAIGVVVLVAIVTASYFVLSRQGVSTSFYNPLLVAALLVANLLAGSALLVLVGRGIARRRAARTVGSGGQLHVRLKLDRHVTVLRQTVRGRKQAKTRRHRQCSRRRPVSSMMGLLLLLLLLLRQRRHCS